MVIVRVSHGLGNQMFQYAAGRALAAANETELKVETAHYREWDDREFGIREFGIKVTEATEEEVAAISGCAPGEHKRGLAKHWDRIVRAVTGSDRVVLRERGRDYDAAMLETRGEIYMLGYWQSRKYFTGIEDELRTDFTFPDTLNAASREVLREIESVSSVAVHVRRGDYVNHPRFEFEGSKEYHERAAKLMLDGLKEAEFFVFSDDIDWLRESFSLPGKWRAVDAGNAKAPIDDMHLMSRCRHQIIANSTFSWWAAWLNRNEEKIVCAPKNWFSDHVIANDDLIPREWRLL